MNIPSSTINRRETERTLNHAIEQLNLFIALLNTQGIEANDAQLVVNLNNTVVGLQSLLGHVEYNKQLVLIEE